MEKSTTDKFIEKAKKIHGNKYDYSMVEYINSQSKVLIKYPKHGIFEQRASAHLNGQGCQTCSIESSRTKQEDFIERATKIHNGKYDYSKVEYVNSGTKVCIICPIHGEFWQIPSTHLRGIGCKVCGQKKRTGKVYGVGVNDVNEYQKDLYKCWKAMLARCYKKNNRAYEGVVVCEEWHLLSNFKKWWDIHHIQGFHLDKDILCKGKKTYSPETCCFVPNCINAIFKADTPFSKGLNLDHSKKDTFIVYGYDETTLKRKKIKRTKNLKEAIIESLIQKYQYAIRLSERCYLDGTLPFSTLELIINRCNLEISRANETALEVMDKFNEIKNKKI